MKKRRTMKELAEIAKGSNETAKENVVKGALNNIFNEEEAFQQAIQEIKKLSVSDPSALLPILKMFDTYSQSVMDEERLGHLLRSQSYEESITRHEKRKFMIESDKQRQERAENFLRSLASLNGKTLKIKAAILLSC